MWSGVVLGFDQMPAQEQPAPDESTSSHSGTGCMNVTQTACQTGVCHSARHARGSAAASHRIP
jgi:hypothetical protein